MPEDRRLKQGITVEKNKIPGHRTADHPNRCQIVGHVEKRIVERPYLLRAVTPLQQRIDLICTIPDHYRDIVDAVLEQVIDLPLDNGAPMYIKQALRNLGCHWQQPSTMPGTQNNRFHNA